MKQKKLLIIFMCFSLLILSGCGNNNTTNNTNTNSNTSRNTERLSTSTSQPTEPKIEVSTFTTRILDRAPNRVTNISITCGKINNYIVKNGDTFSFCEVVGPARASEGYLEADILDSKGKVHKGYGGGNCQVSTTLYNAVLQLPGLTVVERHAHSKDIAYVPKGQDAAISYSSNVDFKFKNDTGKDIQIQAQNTNEEITIRILS